MQNSIVNKIAIHMNSEKGVCIYVKKIDKVLCGKLSEFSELGMCPLRL